jgi:Tol biopolymer transport system component
MTDFVEYRLRLDPGPTPTSFRVEASGAGGERSATFELPFNDDQLENFILKVSPTKRAVRRIDSPEMQLARTFGDKLFKALMAGGIGETFRAADSEARALHKGLRITLSMTDAPRLAAIPWEFLYDAPDFLATSSRTPIVRYLDIAKPRRPFELSLPIRILAVVSSPSDAKKLQTGLERQNLERALAPLVGTGKVEVDWLENATLLALSQKLRNRDYHILHFIGHGGFDETHREGALLFEDEKGYGKIVGGDRLAAALRDRPSLQLVVLNSCEGARGSVDDPFSGVAAALIEREVPAVIGMQFEITDRAAILFATEFYTVLAEGQPVDTAVAEARRSIFADENDVEWATPVLFMRVADGRLFNVIDAKPIPRGTPPTWWERFKARVREVPPRRWALAGAAALIPVALLAAALLLLGRASISVRVVDGSPGQIFINGQGFAPSEEVLLEVDGKQLQSTPADSNGNIAAQRSVDDPTAGTVTALGVTSNQRASATYRGLAVATATPIAPTGSVPVGPSTSPALATGLCKAPAKPAVKGTLADVAPGSILFSSTDVLVPRTVSAIFAIDPATGTVTELTEGSNDTYPMWSPNYSEIAFTRTYPTGDRDIYRLSATGPAVPEVPGPTDDWYPAWAPDGTIAFIREGQPSWIYTWRDHSAEPLRLDPGAAVKPIVGSPAYSVGGSTLVFTGRDTASGQVDLATISADGGTPRWYSQPSSQLTPTWSPDGKTLAMVEGGSAPTRDVWTFDTVSGTNVQQLTKDAADDLRQDGNPVWSVDGEQIAFYKATDITRTGFHIWLVNRDGSGACDLMPDRSGSNVYPSWRSSAP